jgi:hypothetical protein
MYVDKLDGLVDTSFFEKMSNQWRPRNRISGGFLKKCETPGWRREIVRGSLFSPWLTAASNRV